MKKDGKAPALGTHLRPVVYREDFEAGELNGWASYPPCQDTAYNPYVYPGKIRPDDPGTAFVAMEEVHWNEDQFLGGMKRLDLVLDRSFSLSFRYYIKTLDTPVSLEVHIPSATGERFVYTLDKPPANRWFGVRIGWRDFEKQNHAILGRDMIPMTALIIQAKIAKADPDTDVFFAFDDIELSAHEVIRFAFAEPETAVLDEWPERIPLRHYRTGNDLIVKGGLDFQADSVSMELTPFAARETVVAAVDLTSDGNGEWFSDAIPLNKPDFPHGLYRGRIAARIGDDVVSETFFTVFVVDNERFKDHPRLLFGSSELDEIRRRFSEERFERVRTVFVSQAVSYREKVPPETVVYDFDQFPVKDWIPTLWNWFIDRIMNFREALYTNAVLYAMNGDREAGEYCRRVMLALAEFPCWNHPWMEERGFHSYFPIGEMTEAYALAYDFCGDLLSDVERETARRAMIERYVKPTFRTYIEQNRITVNSSNWISHINGGALMALTASLGDDTGYGDLEPWLTGFLLKEHTYISTVFGRDGSYGEGFRYYNFAMHSFARVIPMLERLFGLDLSEPMLESWRETLWAGIPQDDILFTFGDSQGYIKGEAQAYWIGGQSGPMNNFAWLVARTRSPHLAWLYRTLKAYDTFEEVVHDAGDVPVVPPDDLPKVAFFREVGTAVFKSGWGSKDFVFVFRSGPFYNHQHMDQGSFFLADHGEIFFEERYDGDHHYYDDPLYQSHAIRTISHNTILVNGNPQSQEVGDPADFSPGMNDHALFMDRLDSNAFSFASGRLDGVYRGAVKEMWRSVLYIKPRAVLIVDRIVPGPKDAAVDLLFHTERRDDIAPGDEATEFRRNGASCRLFHLAPGEARREIGTDPHFLCQYNRRPLFERGFLKISADTVSAPLVFANLAAATADGSHPDISTVRGNGWVGADIGIEGSNVSVAVNTSDDTVDFGGFKTDAAIVALDKADGAVCIARGTYLVEGDRILISSTNPLTACVLCDAGCTKATCYIEEASDVTIAVKGKPETILVNGVPSAEFTYEPSASIVSLALPEGEITVDIRM